MLYALIKMKILNDTDMTIMRPATAELPLRTAVIAAYYHCLLLVCVCFFSGILRQIAMEQCRVCTPWLGTKQAAGLLKSCGWISATPQNGSTQPWHEPEPYHQHIAEDLRCRHTSFQPGELPSCKDLEVPKDWTNNWSCVLAGTNLHQGSRFD